MKTTLAELELIVSWILKKHAKHYALRQSMISKTLKNGKTVYFLDILQNPGLHIWPNGMENPHKRTPVSDDDGWCDLRQWRDKTPEEVEAAWHTMSDASWGYSPHIELDDERLAEQEFMESTSRWLESEIAAKRYYKTPELACEAFIKHIEKSVSRAKILMAVDGDA